MQTNNQALDQENFGSALKNNIDNIYQISKQKNWTWDYDILSDVLYFCNKDYGFSEDSISMPINEDYISVQINRKGDIEGIVIEDFKNLFVPENMEYEQFAERLIQASEKDKLRARESLLNSEKGLLKMLACDLRTKFIFNKEKEYCPVC